MYSGLWCVLLFISVGNAAKILGVFLTPSYSHQIVYQPIWKELSLRGHQVTVYTPNPLRDPSLRNLTEVDLSASYRITDKCFSKFIGKDISKSEEFKLVLDCYSVVYDDMMSTPEMKKLVANENNEHFDLFLVEFLHAGMYPFKDVYNCPMIGLTSLGLGLSAAFNIGYPKHPTLDPEFVLPFSTDLTFKERVISTIFYNMFRIQYQFIKIPQYNAEARKFFKDTRSVGDIAKEVSLVITNSNYILQNVRPVFPSVIEIAGIHFKPQKPLPQNLQTFLDNSKEGVIYVSLGTNVKISSLSKEWVYLLLSAFSELPYKFLWKFETDDLENLPKNVMIQKWLPQQDVLRHPNIKMFITQGGMQSIDEAVNNTIPMLVIPFYADQHFNADKLVKSGAAVSLNSFQMTKEELVEEIKEVIHNPKYKNAVERLASYAFDQPIPALEKAMWWIEYVLRHNGAPQLKYKALTMPTYQYYLLDVYGFLTLVVFVFLYMLLKIYRSIEPAYHIFRKMLNKAGITLLPEKKSQ